MTVLHRDLFGDELVFEHDGDPGAEKAFEIHEGNALDDLLKKAKQKAIDLIVIGLHHVIGARAKKMAQGKVSEPGPAPAMGWGVLVLAAVTAVVAVLKPF